MVLKHFEFCPNIEICLAELNTNTKLAVGLSRQHALNNPRISRSALFCFPMASNIYTYSVMMQSRQDFYLLDHINTIIDHMVEHGLIFLWNKQNQNCTSKEKSMGNGLPQALTINHMLGAIVILVVGLHLAIGVFVLEYFIISRRKIHPKKYFARIRRYRLFNFKLLSKK